jgi:3-phenylpropionate/trans-cinnamate dioxygenase ferredoxin reductase subunit
MSRPERAIVVGNGVSGHACACRLADRGVPVTLIGPGVPFDRPPLSKRALARGVLPVLADGAALAARGIAVLDGLVEQVNPARRMLQVRTRREHLEIGYDRLVWATGLTVARPPVPGLAAAEDLTTAAGFRRLVTRLAHPARLVTVIGAGLIGCEVAATLARRHRVTLLDTSSGPLARLHERIGAAARQALADAGVRFVGGCLVEAVERREGAVVAVRTTTHGRIGTDVVVAASGVRGTVDSGLGGGRELRTDEHLRVLDQDQVWACGDVAAFPHPRYGRIVVPHWDHARASGVHAADSLLGAASPYIREPYWFSDIGRLRVQQLGLDTHAVSWQQRDGLHVGLDGGGRVACVVLLDAPSRLRDARQLLAA